MVDMDIQITADCELDASGLSCPMPLLKCKQMLNRMAAGEVLLLTATDPGSWRDIHSFADLSQHTLLSAEKAGDTFVYRIKKAS